jgi:hypothetical protein
MEENNRKQQVIDEKIIKQQNMPDQNSTKTVIDNKCNASQLLPLHDSACYEIRGVPVDSQSEQTVVYQPK